MDIEMVIKEMQSKWRERETLLDSRKMPAVVHGVTATELLNARADLAEGIADILLALSLARRPACCANCNHEIEIPEFCDECDFPGRTS